MDMAFIYYNCPYLFILDFKIFTPLSTQQIIDYIECILIKKVNHCMNVVHN